MGRKQMLLAKYLAITERKYKLRGLSFYPLFKEKKNLKKLLEMHKNSLSVSALVFQEVKVLFLYSPRG